MLKSAQREDEEKLYHLIHKMRKGECSVPEIWVIQNFMERGVGLSYKVIRLLQEILAEKESESHADAWIKGLMVIYGRSTRRCRKLAIEILKTHQEDPLCLSQLGSVHWLKSDEHSAFVCWEKSAKIGCVDAIINLAAAYHRAIGVDYDEDRGFELYFKAAEMMHPVALESVGCWYFTGRRVKKNPETAHQYYAQTASLGNHFALFELAHEYFFGENVAKDARRAASLYRLVVLRGYEGPRRYLDRMKKNYPLEVIPYGKWCPDPFMHQFVSNQMHHEMRTVLLMHAREGSLFSQLPRELLHNICFWLCTDPI